MKYTKKFATVVLMLMLVLALAVPTFAKSKAKKPKLSKKSVTLYVKDKTTITLKNAKASKVKWSTSKKSVATVKKGKITAKKKGTAYIKAKYDIEIGVRQCKRLFHRLGYSRIRPQPFPSKGYEDTEEREAFKKNETKS